MYSIYKRFQKFSIIQCLENIIMNNWWFPVVEFFGIIYFIYRTYTIECKEFVVYEYYNLYICLCYDIFSDKTRFGILKKISHQMYLKAKYYFKLYKNANIIYLHLYFFYFTTWIISHSLSTVLFTYVVYFVI